MPTKQSIDNIVTICTKCNESFEGKITKCPLCKNKAYLHSFPILPKAIIITSENRDKLEKHCKTIFPENVIAVVPSMYSSRLGIEELEEEEKNKQLIRNQTIARKAQKAEQAKLEKEKTKSLEKT